MKKLWKRIVAEARLLFNFWSVRLAALGGLVVAYLMSDPTLLPRLVGYVPPEYRPLVSVLIGFIAFALPTLARRLPQPNLKKPVDQSTMSPVSRRDMDNADIQRP